MSTFLNGDPNSTPTDGSTVVYDSALGAYVPGEAISGGVPIFGSQAEAQAYEADNPGKVALWFDGGTEPEPGDVEVTASAPTADDNADTITIPTVTGVDYRIDGTIVTGTYNVGDIAGDVTVTATPQAGYTLTGTTSWTFTFTGSVALIPVTPTGPTWTDDATNGGGTWTTPTETGVVYSPASGTATASQTVTVTATAQSGYYLTGTTSWQHTFPAPAGVVPGGGVVQFAEYAKNVTSTTLSPQAVLDSPATSGNVLINVLTLDKNPGVNVTAPSGWTEISRQANAGVTQIIAWKVAEGGEYNPTWSGTLTEARFFSNVIVELDAWGTPTVTETLVEAATATASPSPAAGAGIALAVASVDSVWNGMVHVWNQQTGPGWSEGYTRLVISSSGITGACGTALAIKALTAGDPTAVTVTLNEAEDLALAVLVVGVT